MDEQTVNIPQLENFNPNGATKVELKTTAKGEIQIGLHVYGENPETAVDMAIQAYIKMACRLREYSLEVAGVSKDTYWGWTILKKV